MDVANSWLASRIPFGKVKLRRRSTSRDHSHRTASMRIKNTDEFIRYRLDWLSMVSCPREYASTASRIMPWGQRHAVIQGLPFSLPQLPVISSAVQYMPRRLVLECNMPSRTGDLSRPGSIHCPTKQIGFLCSECHSLHTSHQKLSPCSGVRSQAKDLQGQLSPSTCTRSCMNRSRLSQPARRLDEAVALLQLPSSDRMHGCFLSASDCTS